MSRTANWIRSILRHEPGRLHTWRGLRLCAVDVSVINLPREPALRDHFNPTVDLSRQAPQARASQLYDVLNRVTLDACLAPNAVGERDLAAGHLAVTRDNDLSLYDRGYPAFWLFALHGRGPKYGMSYRPVA